MKYKEIIKLDNKYYKKYAIFILAFVLIFLIMATSLITEKYNLKEGDIAKSNIKAPQSIKDEYNTKLLMDQAIKNIGPQYTVDESVKETALKNINILFKDILENKKRFDIKEDGQNLSYTDDNITSNIRNSSSVNLSNANIIGLLELEEQDIRNLNAVLISAMSEVYDNKIMEGKEDDLKEAEDSIIFKINNSDLSKSAKELGLIIARDQLKPNYLYDEEKTQELKEKTLEELQPVMIKKGQIIVKEGEPVQKYQIEALKSLGLLDDKNNFQWYIYISLGVLVYLFIAFEWYYLKKYHKDVYEDNSKLVLVHILILISLILARVFSIISPYLIPLACIPMLMTFLLKYKISLILNVITCILIACIVEFNVEIMAIAILDAVIGAIVLRKMQQRNDILYACLKIGVVNIIFTASIGFLLSNNVLDVSKKAAFTFIGSILSGILTVGFLPFFETTFDIITTTKLLELSNPNNLLLRRLLLEAPGTYNHSILVGNLAELAAQNVGGSPLLARVGAYYHDIGKIKRPYFFKENQMGNENPHDKISPYLSTLIIISHVKDGLELAKEYKLPKVIQDMIKQHHGTSLVKYFYVTAKNSSDDPSSVVKEDFKYLGPIPNTKEAAIVMLADGVEASVRSIKNPTKGKVEEMVNNIIKDRLNEGQLNNCDLTLKDLNKIRKAFLKTLGGIYHDRIEYPTDKWQQKKKLEMRRKGKL